MIKDFSMDSFRKYGAKFPDDDKMSKNVEKKQQEEAKLPANPPKGTQPPVKGNGL